MGRKKAKRGQRLWSVQDKHVRGIIEVNTKQFLGNVIGIKSEACSNLLP